MDIQIGTKVLIHGNRSGTVRYYGPVKGKAGNWVGVELDFELGKNDGTFEGYLCEIAGPNKVIIMPLSPLENNPNIQIEPENHHMDTSRTAISGGQIKPKLLDRLKMVACDNIPTQTTISHEPAHSLLPIQKNCDLGTSVASARTETAKQDSYNIRNVEDLQAEILRLHEQKLELIDKLSLAESKRIPEAHILNLQAKLKEREILVDDLTKEKENLIEQLGSLKSNYFSESANLKTQLEQLRRIDQYQEKAVEASGFNHGRDYEIEYNDLSNRLRDIQNAYEEQVYTLESLREQLSNNTGKLNEQEMRFRDTEANLRLDNARLGNQLSDITKLREKEYYQYDQEKQRLQNEVKRAMKEYVWAKSELVRKEEIFNSNLSKTEQVINALQSEIMERDRTISDLNGRILNLHDIPKESLNRVRHRLDSTISTFARLQSEYNRLHMSYEELSEAKKNEEKYFLQKINSVEFSHLNTGHCSLEHVMSENDRLSSKLEQYKAEMRALNERLEERMKTLNQLEATLYQENSLNQRILEEKDKKIDDLSNEVSHLRALSKKNEADAPRRYSLKADHFKTVDMSRQVPEKQHMSIYLPENYPDALNLGYLTKRIRRLKSAFEILGEKSHLAEAIFVESNLTDIK